MASKSNLDLVIDNGSGTTIEIHDDASGYLVITMADSKDSKAMKLAQADVKTLNQCLAFSNAIRAAIPQS